MCTICSVCALQFIDYEHSLFFSESRRASQKKCEKTKKSMVAGCMEPWGWGARKERFTSEVRFAAPHTQSSVRRVSINLFFFSLIFVLNLRHGLRKKEWLLVVCSLYHILWYELNFSLSSMMWAREGSLKTDYGNQVCTLSCRTWNESIVQEACQLLAEDLPLAPGAPGGQVEYRRSLASSFFFKFYLNVTLQLSNQEVYFVHLFQSFSERKFYFI